MLSRDKLRFLTSALCISEVLALPALLQTPFSSAQKDARVLILGGGMAGVTAARTLYDQGIDDFLVIEARHEVGDGC